jgi:hypothetical protein
LLTYNAATRLWVLIISKLYFITGNQSFTGVKK